MQSVEKAPPPSRALETVPLVVDLDGSVLRTDTLIESMFVLARTRPLSLFKLPFWRLKGAAYFKRRLAETAMPDVHLLPYRSDVLAYLRAQKDLGRPLILATAADEKLAREVDREVGLFDEILASDGHVHLSGKRKRDRLVAEFGQQGFDYIGNHAGDYPAWGAARRALLVSPSPHLEHKVAKFAPVERILREPSVRWRDYLHALRPHHWIKNCLVFLPLVSVHQFFDVDLLERATLAFIAFNLCASSVYLLNDLMDLPADRCHPRKRERRLAAGRVPLAHALLMMPLLLAGAFSIAWHLTLGVAAVLALYCVMMISYSMKLKDLAIVDVLVLAGGYALRVAAGSLAVDIGVSAWLLTYCMFLFFSLALIKRYSELVMLESMTGAEAHARGYLGVDKVILAAQGIASGYLAVLVLALYTNSDIIQQLYARHNFFWTICLLLLYWVSYLWMMAVRGRIHEDPLVFALADPVSRWTIAVMGLVALLAI